MTLAEIAKATGWQNHSIRGFLSGQVTKKMGLKIGPHPDSKVLDTLVMTTLNTGSNNAQVKVAMAAQQGKLGPTRD